jgi:hypothetical protein
MREDADRGVIDPGRGAEQDHPILCTKLRRRLRHGLLPPPALWAKVAITPRASARSRASACPLCGEGGGGLGGLGGGGFGGLGGGMERLIPG